MQKQMQHEWKETPLRLALKLVATGRDAREILTAVVRMVESQCDGAVASILLLDPDGKHLRHGAAPNLPAEYNRAVDGLEVGPAAGSCGTAVFRGQPVIVDDIATDPLWTSFKEIAVNHGLRACWSHPIFASDGSILGSFAIYPKLARRPEPSEITLIESAADLAAVAMERHRADQEIRNLNANLEQRVAERTAELESRTRQLETSAEHNRLLVGEVEHRVGNNLAGLIGLVAHMRKQAHNVDGFASAIDARLKAMAHIHQLLLGVQKTELNTLILSTLEAQQPLATHAALEQVDGPELTLNSRQTYALASILTEWFTNSCKYGAHSVAGGELRIAWTLQQIAGEQWVRLTWTERGGPPPAGEIKPSLGTVLAQGFSSKELKGNCQMCYPPEGAGHVLEFPLREKLSAS